MRMCKRFTRIHTSNVSSDRESVSIANVRAFQKVGPRAIEIFFYGFGRVCMNEMYERSRSSVTPEGGSIECNFCTAAKRHS